MALNSIVIARELACLFFAALFLQSGLDKVTDRKGNLDWLVPHFANSPFARGVPLLVSMLTALELLSGFGALAAAVVLLASPSMHYIAVAGLGLCGVSLLCLFIGQRLAKDYAGAATIAAYFGGWMIAMFLLEVGFAAQMP